MQFKIQVSGQPTFHRANSTAQKFQVIMLSGGLMPIGDTLVTTLYLLKVLFGLVSDRGSMMKILSGLAMRGLENAFPVLIFMKTDSGSSGSQHDSAAMFHSNSEVDWNSVLSQLGLRLAGVSDSLCEHRNHWNITSLSKENG